MRRASEILVEENDRVIICAFAQLTPEEAEGWEPRVVICDEDNVPLETITYS